MTLLICAVTWHVRATQLDLLDFHHSESDLLVTCSQLWLRYTVDCKRIQITVRLTSLNNHFYIVLSFFSKWPRFKLFNFSTCAALLLTFVLFFPSTIHGRIDQVNQLLELDYQKRGGARYTALDKWTNQLNTLNQAIVSKLTWWHEKETREWHV